LTVRPIRALVACAAPGEPSLRGNPTELPLAGPPLACEVLYAARARATMPPIRSMWSMRIGHEVSVTPHWASVIPHPHVQRASPGSSSAARFCVALRSEKSIIAGSLSVSDVQHLRDAIDDRAAAPIATVHIMNLDNRRAAHRLDAMCFLISRFIGYIVRDVIDRARVEVQSR
jgi:hypothetical protein